MKVVAMYLPQFHRTDENDKWWGEGFTDWDSTRKAQALFEGHYQPHEPLDGNYYDLSKKETLQWQASLMKKYGVDAMCFYHYYFEQGRMVLEKPSELLLSNKDIDMPFCFCWANETWARSWSGVKGANAWNEVAENDANNDDGILLKQVYGNERAWEEHFNYLLPFFKDERYLRVNGRPVFLFYRTKLIDCVEKMTQKWNELAVKNGLEGVYFIANDPAPSQLGFVDAELFHEPVKSNTYFIESQFTDKEKHVDYDALWNQILQTPLENRKVYYGGFVSYDDTPRRGKRGIAVTGANPKSFCNYLSLLMKKNEMAGNEITFINAWNEWGEGMHLEPDCKYGYGFLESILEAKDNYGKVFWDDAKSNIGSTSMKRCEKFELYLNDLDLWLTLREKGISLCEYLENSSVKTVAICGFGIMGRHLMVELEKKYDVFVIDRQGNRLECSKPVFSFENAPDSDVTIIASYYYFNDIRADLVGRKNIISLGDMIHWTWSEKINGEKRVN